MSEIKETAKNLMRSVEQSDPKGLLLLGHLSFDEKCDLRESLREIPLTDQDRDLLLQWAWHEEPQIQNAVRTLILLLRNNVLMSLCFEKVLKSPDLSAPYEIDYNASEKEFHVEFPGVPGIGVSHYGREGKEIDRLLLALERIYQKMHPEMNFPWFRN